MQIDIRPEVFSTPGSLPRILSLLECVQEGRHDWVADESVIPAAESYLHENLPLLADAYVSLSQKGLVNIQWTGSIERPSVVVIQTDNLDDISYDLARPAALVVEDERSDGSFVRSLCQAFGADRILQSLSRGWMEIRHGGGGGSVPSVAEAEVEKFRRKVRVAVMLDSDRLIPGEHTRAYETADKLRSMGAVVHVLELREIENYIPNRVLASIKPIRVSHFRLDHLKLLTPDQRAVYDMKSGFGPASGPPVVHSRQSGVFGTLASKTLVGLRAGFGTNAVTYLAAMADSLTERDFQTLGGGVVAEIATLLREIASVI